MDWGSPPCSPQTPTLSPGSGGPAPLRPEAHQLPDAVEVDHLEGVARQQAELQVGVHHAALDVVTGEAEGHLRQVVGPEGEEVRHLGDLGGAQRGPGRLDHRPDGHVELAALGRAGPGRPLGGARCRLPVDLGHRVLDPAPGQRQLGPGHRQRDHDLDDWVPAVDHALPGRLHERAHLHGVEPGLDHPEPHAARPEHGVRLRHDSAAS